MKATQKAVVTGFFVSNIPQERSNKKNKNTTTNTTNKKKKMVLYTAEQIRVMMQERTRVRNIAVVAHVDHGKTTLTDSLVASAGLIRRDTAGDSLLTETRQDERDRGITIKSTGVSLCCAVPESAGGGALLINLIDSPGHVDFSSEVTAALRLTDGALVVVDVSEGPRVQTETVLRQALAERVKPILVLNKFDRPFNEKRDFEDVYQSLRRTIESVNVLVSSVDGGRWCVSPENGSVVFAAAVQGWAFSLRSFAEKYAAKARTSPEAIAQRMWGDVFFDEKDGKWYPSPVSADGRRLERGFCRLVMKPLAQVLDMCATATAEQLAPFAEERLGVHLGPEDADVLRTADQRHRARTVLQKWIPADAALVEAIFRHLPNPVEAQAYRTELLYTGAMDDPAAASMRACDGSGPLVVYISKMVPDEGSSGSRFFAFGRVFSGTVTPGQKVDIWDSLAGDAGAGGGGGGKVTGKSVQRVLVAMGGKFTAMASVTAGNTVALIGIDQFIQKSGTIVGAGEATKPLRSMKFSVSPVVRVAVETKNPADLPKLLEALRRLSKSDQLVVCTTTEQGEHVIATAGELHLDIALHDLRGFLGDSGIESDALRVTDPVVPYLEMVTRPSGQAALSKSTNKLNRLFARAEPLPAPLVEALSQPIPAGSSATRIAAEHLSWTTAESRKIWAFGPTLNAASSVPASCMLVDQTKAIAYLQEIRDTVVAGFNWVTREGPIIGEPMRGVRFDLTDALVHADPKHHGSPQVLPAARRVFSAAVLMSAPRLVEPLYLLEVQCPRTVIGAVYSVICGRRGQILDEASQTANIAVIRATLPVAESFGINAELRSESGGAAFPQLTFHSWEFVPEDPLAPGSKAAALVRQIRKRKGLREDVPPLSEFADKL